MITIIFQLNLKSEQEQTYHSENKILALDNLILSKN